MRRLSVLLVLLAVAGSVSGAGASLQVSGNGRYLVDQDGRPFLMTGDSPWSLFVEPTLAEAQFYLEDRAARGFNTIVVNLIEHRFATNAPDNLNGDPPFTGAPFTTPNEPYFAHVDSIMEIAEAVGLTVALSPVYLGYQCGNQGWCQEILAASPADLREWGRFVGERYGSYDNILWVIGGDADPEPVKDELREFVAGIREFDTTNLITAHNHRDTQAVTYWPGEPWIQVNSVFGLRDALYQGTQAAYDHSPTLPYFLFEGFYENERGVYAVELRAQAYWTLLTGGFGLLFGNCPIWHFGYASTWCGLTDWVSELPREGSVEMGIYRTFFESRRWWLLVPDVDNTVLVSGQGVDGSEEYATAAATSDGSSIIVYAPTPREMTLDTSVLAGSTVRVWGFDPTDGSTEMMGEYPSGLVNIPVWPGEDRVFVLDSAEIGFPAPGTPLPVSSPADLLAPQLDQNTPNPFNPRTTIRYTLPRPSRVRITIFDVAGRKVRNLVDRLENGGNHETTWDGNDDAGRSMASGVYFYRLEIPTGSTTRKMVLLR